MSKVTIYILLEHSGNTSGSWKPVAISLTKKTLYELAEKRRHSSGIHWDIKQRTLNSLKPTQIKHLI